MELEGKTGMEIDSRTSRQVGPFILKFWRLLTLARASNEDFLTHSL